MHTCVNIKLLQSLLLWSTLFYSPRRILEGGGVANELMGLEGVTAPDGEPAEGNCGSALSRSLPRLMDGRLSF